MNSVRNPMFPQAPTQAPVISPVQPPLPAPPPNPSAIWPAVLSALVALSLYAVTLGGSYVYDDRPIVLDDARVHPPIQWTALWTRDYFNGGADNLYRPLISSSYAIQWYLHGDRPWVFHAVNILLHALAAAGVAEFTRRALQPDPRATTMALCAGLLFAVHPVHVEAVANIVGRAELACTGALFGALIILARRPLTTRRVISAVTLAIIALLCKEQGILQPLLWLSFGLLIWRFSPSPGNEEDRQAKAVKLLVLITSWTWAIYIIGREHYLKFEWDRSFLDPAQQPMLHCVGIDRLLLPITLFGRYVSLLVWPAHLSPDYGTDVIGSIAHISDPYLWIGALSLVALIAGIAINAFRRQRFALFCLISFAICYGLIGNIFTLIGTIFAERLIYLPSAFFLMWIGNAIGSLSPKPRAWVMAILLMLGSFHTFTIAREWNHPLQLFAHASATHPRSLQLRLLIAQEYHLQGNEPQAQATMSKATQDFPNDWHAWYRRADHAMDANNLQAAQLCLDRAKQLNINPALIGAQAKLNELRARRLK